MSPLATLAAGLPRLGRALVTATLLSLLVLGPASAEPSRYGGTLVVGLSSGDPGSLDPTTGMGAGPGGSVLSAICERLYTIGSKAEIVPTLAAALPTISADKLTYTIPLRKGILFNDGTPFNAQAVVTTLQRDMTFPGSNSASLLTDVSTVTAPDPYTVVIHLSGRDAALPDALTTMAGWVMSPTQLASLGANFGNDPVCVGPFMFDHRDVGQDVTVIKSPYYYDKYAVHLDKIVFVPMTDAAAGVAALQAGDIQVLIALDPSELPAVQENHNLSYITPPNATAGRQLSINIGNKNGTGILPYANAGTPLAQSAKLRQAFEEAIDRNAIVKVALQGEGEPACTPILPENTEWYDPTIPCAQYDPADARRLVAASGYGHPTVHLLVPNDTVSLLAAQVIQSEEVKAGFNLVIEPATAALANSLMASGNFDVRYGPGSNTIDPDGALYRQFSTGGSSNSTGYSNPRMDYVLANARKATSFKARRTLYRVALQILLKDRPIITLVHLNTAIAFSSNVTGVGADANGIVNYTDSRFRIAFAQYK
jgi:peptide/nickel transport system substrate-binding protein